MSKALDDLSPVFDKAMAIISQREEVYGDSWRQNGCSVCIPEVLRKASYIKAQWERGKQHTPKFEEDLLDLMNWSAIAYWHVIEEKEDGVH